MSVPEVDRLKIKNLNVQIGYRPNCYVGELFDHKSVGMLSPEGFTKSVSKKEIKEVFIVAKSQDFFVKNSAQIRCPVTSEKFQDKKD